MAQEQVAGGLGSAGGVDPVDGPAERLSWVRLGILLLVVAGLVGAGAVAVHRALTPAATRAQSWGVPYVDVTLTPTYQFQDPQSNPARDIALAFVVADRGNPCTPSWGAAYTLDQAAQQLELDRRIAQLRAVGGNIMLSLGGQANTELAVACTDVGRLTAAYRQLLDRYAVDVLDLDVEGTAVADQPSILRRAQALAALQRERRAAGRSLAVWLTVPVTPTGLDADGVQLVSQTVRAGVQLTGVNVMTMDFAGQQGAGQQGSGQQGAGQQGSGQPGSAPPEMLALTERALDASARQLAGIYSQVGVILNEGQRWARLGATVMIGQNDVNDQVFTLDDARRLAGYAQAKGLGRVSLWSINRDTPCGASFADVAVHSNTCSGVKQRPLAFTNVFVGLPGHAPDSAPTDAITLPTQQGTVDDPARSPYPVWRPTAQYPENYKVVWHGLVYQAKWFTQGSDPSAVLGSAGQNPWALLGPVESTDAPPSPVPTVTGVHRTWNVTQLYTKGDRVLFNGLPYQARWLTKGDVPPTEYPVGTDSPWQPLFTIPGEPVSTS